MASKRKFRLLNADEIECRVATVSEKGCSLLLYKDARADMNLLDETLGYENWQRKHELINGNLFCSVGIKVDGEWIWKQDVGTESNTEAEKGQASDAFKRACVNLGIGRELYTAPFIWIGNDGVRLTEGKNGKTSTYDKFKLTHIAYDDKGNITELKIKNISTGKQVFTFGCSSATDNSKTKTSKNTSKEQPKEEPKEPEQPQENEPAEDLVKEADLKSKVIKYMNNNLDTKAMQSMFKFFKIKDTSELTVDICNRYIEMLAKKGKTIDD